MRVQAGAEAVDEGDCANAQSSAVALRRTGAVLVQALLDDPQKDAQRGIECRTISLQKVAQPLRDR